MLLTYYLPAMHVIYTQVLEQLPAFISTGEKLRSRLHTSLLGEEEGFVDFREILQNEPYCSLISRYII